MKGLHVYLHQKRTARWATAVAMACALAVGGQASAQAAPVYEATGAWVDPPAQVSATDVVVAEWRFNVNDDAAAPKNSPVDNVTATITAENALFAQLPDLCRTSGVEPVSEISEDGRTLVCNVGTKQMGTSVVIQSGLSADGATGSKMSATMKVGGKTASVPQIPIVNPFAMDMVWTQPSEALIQGASASDLEYTWTLFRTKNSSAGPNTVSYDINVKTNNGKSVAMAGTPCTKFTAGNATGHPYSGGTHDKEQIAPYVQNCTVTKTGDTTFRLTLTGIDYSQNLLPTYDSTGRPLPPGQAAVASGSMWIKVNSAPPFNAEITTSAPTYTSATGEKSTDDATNNKADKSVTSPSGFSAQFLRYYTNDGGTFWDNNYRVYPGEHIMQAVPISQQLRQQFKATDTLGACSVIDTKYLTYEWSEAVLRTANPSVKFKYYVGSSALLNPASSSYNPNAFKCGDDASGWTSTEPADKTKVKAVQLTYAVDELPYESHGHLNVAVQVKLDAPVGQDVWTWSSINYNGYGWNDDRRNTDGTYKLSTVPDSRYNYTTTNRDVLHVVGLKPYIAKSVDRSAVLPGDPATYTLEYQLFGRSDKEATADGLVLTDTLPVGMTYVTGSSTPAPKITTAGTGAQVLTWTLNGVKVNALQAQTFQAVAAPSVKIGTVLTNSVTATLNNTLAGDRNGQPTDPATADVAVAGAGFTTIAKTADQNIIANPSANGNGTGSWTVTLRSYDPIGQAATDTIDILPYVGDQRGTKFSGSYVLDKVEPMSGGTVWYSSTDPATLTDDPAHASNGSFANPGGAAGWTKTKPAKPTAIRVIGPELAPGASQQFRVFVKTTAMKGDDLLVNRAQGRATHTQLVMRTSASLTMAKAASADLKKYVKDSAGVWHDANDAADYPTFMPGDKVTYKIVVTNTGEATLTNIAVHDDVYSDQDYTIASLKAGAKDEHEFTVTLAKDAASTVVNTASATAGGVEGVPGNPTVVIPTDPAGINVVNYKTVKTSDPASGSSVRAGQKVTYTVKVTPSGTGDVAARLTDDLSGVLDDATYNGDVKADAGTVKVEGSTLTWAGTLTGGKAATITYSVTVKSGGDMSLHNQVASPGCETDAAGKPVNCDTTHLLGSWTVSKTSNPATGTVVTKGQKVTYSVEVKQVGKGAVAAMFTDTLAAVLDDATWNDDAAASSGTVKYENGVLTWNGDLGVGKSAKVTYSVTVKGQGSGDDLLKNVVVPGTPGNGDTPADPKGGTCVDAPDGNKNCTTQHPLQPVGGFTVSKTSNPATKSEVTKGDKVTYTVEVKQTGNGPVAAKFTDTLAKVLDDATWNNDATATAGTVKYENGVLTWTGDLGVGKSAKVTYSVTVKGQGSGDDLLKNVVVPGTPGNPGGGTCVDAPDGNKDCTTQHPLQPVGGFTVSKTSDPKTTTAVQKGQKVTYTVEVKQTGNGPVAAMFTDTLAAVLDDATWNGDAKASSGTVKYENGTLTWNGDLGIGKSATITYSATVKGQGSGDDLLKNVVVPGTPAVPGDPGTPADPKGGTCVDAPDGNKDCTTQHPLGAWTVSKTSNPKTGTAVTKDQKVTYTVEVKQVGKAAVSAMFTDTLAKVLDDATWNGDAKASSGDVSYSDGVLTWTGDLGVGKSATITYSVTVKGEGSGDDLLNNVVVPGTPATGDKPADPKGGTCVDAPDGNKDCTTQHPLQLTGGFTVSKTSDPKPGSAVEKDQKVTYSVEVKQTGKAAVQAMFTDTLAKVLDDATWNNDAKATSGTVKYENGILTWNGDLGVGKSATITYSVTVKGQGSGDDVMKNVVIPGTSDDPKGGTCVDAPDGNKDCTTDHLLGGFTVSKTSNPATGTTVAKDQKVTYSVEVKQVGAKAVSAMFTDTLTKVLDDATWNNDAEATSGTVKYENGTLTWTGDLGVGTSATITYSVTVKGAGAGDDLLKNVVVPGTPAVPGDPGTPADPKGGTCVDAPDGNKDCTTQHPLQPVGAFSVSKTSDPKPGTAVKAGQKVTYSVEVKQTGNGAVAAKFTDTLTGVLDDATWNDDATASAGTVAFKDGVLTWSGDLGVGKTATITYSVTVKDGGDKLLKNVVVPDPKDGTCIPAPDGNKDCTTEHPMGGFTVSKTSDPKPGSAVEKGQKVTYTVEVKQTGKAAVTGKFTDTLAKVLDDATWNDDAAATAGTVAFKDGVLSWSGDLGVGKSATITYSVTVKGQGSGDDVLNNVVVPDGGTCVEAPDGNAGCETDHLIGGFTVSKTSDPATGTAVEKGQKVTYTVEVKQVGAKPVQAEFTDTLAKVLDDATYNDDAKASSGKIAYTDGVLTWSGDLGLTEKATVTYSVTVKGQGSGDDLLNNVVVPGTPATGDKPADPKGGICVDAPDGNKDCTTQHPLGAWTVSKTSDPATGTAVKKGQKVTYTVEVRQVGKAAVPAMFTDTLAKVLDDATYNDDAKASSGDVAYSDGVLTWNGDLGAGKSATITYSVTVKGQGSGDDLLNNVVVPGVPAIPGDPENPEDPGTPADPKGGTCITAPDGNKDCTTQHPLGGFTVSKTSDPRSGTAVEKGQKVTYTVEVKQLGKAAVPDALITDDLTGLLDDATWNDDALASSGTVTRSGNTLTWTGDLGVGKTATITYSVTVKGQGSGDDQLRNVVIPGTTDDPRGGTCVDAPDGNKDCTTAHPIGGFTVSKTSNPVTGSAVKAGQKITYTVRVAQTGEAAVPAMFTDTLAKVLDDAKYNNDALASSGKVAYEDGVLTWNGDLGVGDTAKITYSVTVGQTRGDNVLTNVVVPGTPAIPGDPENPDDPGTPADPKGGTCVDAPDGNKGCTTTQYVGSFTVSKTSDPAPGSGVFAGQKVTYTLDVRQVGTARVAAKVTDTLAKVLDDAEYNNDAKATSGDVAVKDGVLVWSGDLGVGEKATITYSVTVKGQGAGDDLLNNVAVPGTPAKPGDPANPDDPGTPADPEGGVCVDAPDGNPDCATKHPVRSFTVSKTSDPASGSAVTVGQTITYTLRVAQAGKAPVEAALTDDLAAVLDDATLTGKATASLGTVKVEGTTLHWAGTVPVGGVVDITYQVTVTGKGDKSLRNVVTPDAGTPGTCVPAPDGNKGCTTTHPMGAYTVSKTSNPKPGSAVKAGQTVTYTVRIDQTGPGAVKDATIIDDLSQVLDDASWNGAVTASSGKATYANGKLTWTGDLGVGQHVDLTYTVTTKDGGNGHLHNQVTPVNPATGKPGDGTPGTCVPAPDGNKGCATDHYLGSYTVSKTSDPKAGTAVQDGQKVTYTVRIAQVGVGAVSNAVIRDTLTGVLDDATYNGDAKASAGAVKVSGTDLTWSGDLTVGQVVDLTYSVTVTGKGDRTLKNVVVPVNDGSGAGGASGNARGVCIPAPDGNPGCATAHPMEQVVLAATNPIQRLAQTGAAGLVGLTVTTILLIGAGSVLVLRYRRREV